MTYRSTVCISIGREDRIWNMYIHLHTVELLNLLNRNLNSGQKGKFVPIVQYEKQILLMQVEVLTCQTCVFPITESN